MTLKYFLTALLISAAAVLAGCASTGSVEDYYLKPASGDDAARIDAVEQEIIQLRQAKDASAKESDLLDYEIKVAEEDLDHEKDLKDLLNANYDFAVAKNAPAEVAQAKAAIEKNKTDVETKECILELLKAKKNLSEKDIELKETQLDARLAERDYLRAKVARVNQDKELGIPDKCSEEDLDRINVSEYEEAWKEKLEKEKDAQSAWDKSSADVKEADVCGGSVKAN